MTWVRRAVVVLAAGASSRMPQHKLLINLGGMPVVRHAVLAAIEARVGDVVVVLGRDAPQVRRVLEDLPCTFLENPHYLTGMGSSFRVAAEHLQDCPELIFMLADMPFVPAVALQQLAALDAPLATCRYGEVQAPPVKVSNRYYPDLLELQEGAKPLMQKHRGSLQFVQRPAEEVLDLDTPEDHQQAVSRFEER